ncbi:hypothetical protein HY793_04265, partial [Candidatus Desantisbacteria bacterium]|nr:hypothetical protein [Candidatus Desantisbacteria bacterium]
FKILSEIITYTPQQGSVGTTVTIIGRGYDVGVVRIDFGTSETIATLISTQNGTFSVTFRVDTQCYGTKMITVSTDNTNNTTIFTITSAYIITLKPIQGSVTTIITLEGVGFDKDGTVTIDFGTHYTITTAIASISGTFSVTFIVDTQPAGTTYVTASTENQQFRIIGANSQPTTFLITGAYITIINPTSGAVGKQIIAIEGVGFDKNAIVSIDFGTHKTITTTTSTPSGTFSATFLISTQSHGTKIITAYTSTQQANKYHNQITATVYITGAYIILVNPTHGSVSTLITVKGVGFDNFGTITINFGLTNTIAIQQANPDGTLSVVFKVDTQCYGTHTITAETTNEKGITSTFFVENPYITLLVPSVGSVSAIVTVQGVGFRDSAATVRIDFGNEATITTTTTSPRGTFSVTFVVNTQFAGSKVITASTGSDVYATTVFRIQMARITLIEPKTGIVGTVVTVEGLGFGTGAVTISFGTNPTITTTTASSLGTFSCTFLVDTQPYNNPDNKTITVTGFTEDGAIERDINLNVFKIIPSVVVMPLSGPVGTPVTVIGAGYFYDSGQSGGDQVRILFGTDILVCFELPASVNVVSTKGTFSSIFIVNTQVYGTTVFTVKDTSGGQNVFATSTFFIRTNIISLAPKTATVQTPVTIIGTGYGSVSTIQIDFGTQMTITTTTSSIHGTFSTTFIVNTQVANTQVITVRDITTLISGAVSTTTFGIQADIIIVNPSSGFVGEVVTVEGRGFGYETVRIDFGTHYTITTAIAGINGTFSVTFRIDTQPAHTTVITATGLASEQIATTPIFQIKPRFILLTPTEDIVGNIVTIEGTGYQGSKTIRISFGSTTTITTTTSSTNGTFSTTFIINTQPYSSQTITARANNAPYEDSTTVFAIITSRYTSEPKSGNVGNIVSVSGAGYKANEVIHIHFGTHITITTTNASVNGSFSVTFMVSSQVYGTKQISVTGTGIPEIEFAGSYTILPKLMFVAPLPLTGPVDTVVTIIGAGYSSGTVRIDFGSHPTITTATADENGTFSITFIIDTQPLTSPGNRTKIITVTGSGAEPYCTTVFVLYPKITLNPTTGFVGEIVTILGEGFYWDTTGSPNNNVRIGFGTDISNPAYYNENAMSQNGTFSVTFIINTQPGGTTVVTGIDLPFNEEVYATNLFYITGSITVVIPQIGSVSTVVTVI